MPCKKCGHCCEKLYIEDKIAISIATRSLVLTSPCPYLNWKKECDIQDKKPNYCRKWECGACLDKE